MGLLRKLRKMMSKKASMSVGTVSTEQQTAQKQDFPEVKPVTSSKDLLKEWSKTLEMVESHPLSQARVLNTAILDDLNRVLHSMDEKLEKLSKVDDIYHLLLETKKQLEGAGLPTSNVDAVIGSIKGLTIKDRDALSFFKIDELLTTEDFADKASMSRSTASSRLNKLFSFGLLDKVAEGKKIGYKLKQ